ncbi:MAG: hypothetical protein QOE55_815 [Acidobacteriaceae bacterium]|nr:hypothetical protein [Acidobacteriaceae bacterium]
MDSMKVTRRKAIALGAAGSFTFLPPRVLGRSGMYAPSDKLNIAFIGIGITGWTNIRQLASQNIVGLCDVDWRTPAELGSRANDMASATIQKYPDVKRFDDWRVMLETLEKQIDAVVISTSDHTHAVAALTALKMGKHVYCEKPLAHNVQEVRAMMQSARVHPTLATQTGFQGHASEDLRSIVEWVRDGAIGTVRGVHVFQQGYKPRPGDIPVRPAAGTASSDPLYRQIEHVNDQVPVPPLVKWDLWLGPAPTRNYNPMYVPLRWRNWLDFGTGILGDHGPHFFDPVVWALNLGFPESVQAETDAGYDPTVNLQTFPRTAKVEYMFPARENRPAVSLTWFGNRTPPIPPEWNKELEFPDGGGIIYGTKGSIVYGPMYRSEPGSVKLVWLLPEELDRSYKRPAKTLPRPASHWLDWANAAKESRQTTGNFEYGGLVTQICLLGNIAIRLKGQKLNFNPATQRFTNSAAANAMFQRIYRPGWELPV